MDDAILKITRAAFIRRLTPQQWEAMLTEYRQRLKQSSTEAELQEDNFERAVACALVNLIIEQGPVKYTSPVIDSLVAHSLNPVPNSSSFSTRQTSVRPAILATELLKPRTEALAPQVIDNGLAPVNAALSSRREAVASITMLQTVASSSAVFTELLQTIVTCTQAVTATATSRSLTPTMAYLLRLLRDPPLSLDTFHTTSSQADSLDAIETCRNALATAFDRLSETGAMATADLRIHLQRAIAAMTAPSDASAPNENVTESLRPDTILSTSRDSLPKRKATGPPSASPERKTRSKSAIPATPFDLDRVVPPARADPDAALLISSLISRHSSAVVPPLGRLRAFLAYRAQQGAARGSTSTSRTLECALSELLMATAAEVSNATASSLGGGFRANAYASTSKVRVEAWAFSRIPIVLQQALTAAAGSGSGQAVKGWADAMAAAVRQLAITLQPGASSTDQNSMSIDSDSMANSVSHPFLEKLLPALARQGLITDELVASLLSTTQATVASRANSSGLSASDLEAAFSGVLDGQTGPGTIRNALVAMIEIPALQAAGSRSLIVAITSAAGARDLQALRTLCEAILNARGGAVLDVVWAHVKEPAELLRPVCQFLDTFDTGLESFSDNHPIEGYGKIVLWLQVVLRRSDLNSNLPASLGCHRGFCVQWLPATPAVYTLSALDDEARTAVKGWLEGLFGDGISDELMHSTSPRVLLHIAPTICKQALAACHAGVIDSETLRDSFSYFSQDLLSFTLPGVLKWLTGEISRTAPSPERTTLLDICGLFVLHESLPSHVLELVSTDLASLMAKLAPPPSGSSGKLDNSRSIPGSSLDVKRIDELLRPYVTDQSNVDNVENSSSASVAGSWPASLASALPLALNAGDEPSLPNAAADARIVDPSNIAGTMLLLPPADVISASTLLSTLMQLHVDPTTANSPAAYARASRLRRLAASMLLSGSSPASPSSVFVRLHDLTARDLPYRLSQLCLIDNGEDIETPTKRLDSTHVQQAHVLAELLGEALLAAWLLAKEMPSTSSSSSFSPAAAAAISSPVAQVQILLDNVAHSVSAAWSFAQRTPDLRNRRHLHHHHDKKTGHDSRRDALMMMTGQPVCAFVDRLTLAFPQLVTASPRLAKVLKQVDDVV